MNLPQIENQILTNKNLQIGKIRDIEELKHLISSQTLIFQQIIQTFESVINLWKNKFIISSPIKGKISFIFPIQENQFVQEGKIFGYVNPLDSRYYVQVTLPQYNFGKLLVGQRVQLRLDAYPYQEFGFIEGKLNYISNVPSDSGFLGRIYLTNGLVTNSNAHLQFKNGLTSQALIITKDTRLLSRLFYTLTKSLQR